MIQELPTYEDATAYYDEPLLEYLVKVAEEQCHDINLDIRRSKISSLVTTFCNRLFAGKIKMCDVARKRFIEANEVNATINAFGIDANKLFYLCLYLKDYAIGQTIDSAKINPTHREELEMLVNELSKLKPKLPNNFKYNISCSGPARRINKLYLSENIYTEYEGKITVKIGNGVQKTISDGQTLTLIKEAISNYLLHAHHNNPYLDNAPLRPSKTSELPPIYRISIFYQLLKQFLDPYKVHRVKEVSTDKTLLISRLVYVFALSNDKRYYDITFTEKYGKKSFLKSNLSHYLKIIIPTANKYYSF